MAENWTQKEIWETIALCKKKSMIDPEFRKKMLNDPAGAVKELTGKDVPSEVKFQVLEQDPSANMAIVLPPVLHAELSDEELDKVSAAKVSFDEYVANCGTGK